MADDFNARAATLHHAAESRRATDHASDASVGLAMAIGELANTVACGLVYVGDQIAEQTLALDMLIATAEGGS